MVVISRRKINEFSSIHADATDALLKWYYDTKLVDWNNFNEMKQTFNSVDFVGEDRYVFNIKGNKYRLVAVVHFSIRTVYIKFIGTHKEYDRIDILTINDN